MADYKPNDFISAINKKIGSGNLPACPLCGKRKYTTTDQLATILIGTQFDEINIGPSIPAGMMICENCGHIDFVALGALGLLGGIRGNG